MRLACIIPTSFSHKSIFLLSRCIDSINKSRQLVKNRLKLEIFLVTTNQKAISKKADFKDYTIILSEKKLGYSGMNNKAIDRLLGEGKFDYILLINDDAWLKKDFFKNFLLLKDKKSDFFVPLIYREDGGIDSFGVEYFKSGYAKNTNFLDIKTQLFSASCLLTKVNFLKKIKKKYGFYFNNLLYFYLEDVDLAIRSMAIGATFSKSSRLVAYHQVSATTGKKSFFTIYQTYRNILWLIIMLWPTKIFIRRLPFIVLVQLWMLTYSTFHYGPRLYLSILVDTAKKIKILFAYRKKILSSYNKNFNFSKVFSKYSFRTYYGWKI